MKAGELGCVAPGAQADLLVVEGDHLNDMALLAGDGRYLRVIMRAGQFILTSRQSARVSDAARTIRRHRGYAWERMRGAWAPLSGVFAMRRTYFMGLRLQWGGVLN
jgi:hypothetical protein